MSYAALPTLRTPRLTLRPLIESDAPAIVAGVGNYDVSKWLSALPYPYDPEDADYFIAKTQEDATPTWAICDDSGLVGVIGLDNGLGYWLARPSWGRGYGFEAAQAVVAHCFADPSLRVMDSAYFTGNERSGAILRALGFEEMHIKQIESKPRAQEVDAHAMRLTREAWETRQSFVLDTARLRLRPVRQEDAPALLQARTPEVARNLRNVPRDLSLADVRDSIRRNKFTGLPGFALAVQRDGDCIGAINLKSDPMTLGYYLLPDHHGQGLMSEALAAFLPEVFARFPLNRIEADHFEDNPASGAILRKFGFVETGREIAQSKARLEPAPLITYALTRKSLKVPT